MAISGNRCPRIPRVEALYYPYVCLFLDAGVNIGPGQRGIVADGDEFISLGQRSIVADGGAFGNRESKSRGRALALDLVRPWAMLAVYIKKYVDEKLTESSLEKLLNGILEPMINNLIKKRLVEKPFPF